MCLDYPHFIPGRGRHRNSKINVGTISLPSISLTTDKTACYVDPLRRSGSLFTKQWDVFPQDFVKSRSREIRVYFPNRFEFWYAARQLRCRDACQISERYDQYDIQPRGIETSRELAVRRRTTYHIWSSCCMCIIMLPLIAQHRKLSSRKDSEYLLLLTNPHLI